MVPTDADLAVSHRLLPCLQILFNTGFSSGAIPQSWETLQVLPICEKGNNADKPNLG